MDFEHLDPELKAKAEACETPEELMKLAADAGYELSEKDIEGIAGGASWDGCEQHKHRRLNLH